MTRSSLGLLVCFLTCSGHSRIEFLWSSCFEDYSAIPSFQVVHQTSVSHVVSLLERWKSWWYSVTNRTDGHTYGNHSSSFTWDSLSNLFRPNLSNSVRRLYNCRHSCFVNITYTLSAVNFQDLIARSWLSKNSVTFVLLNGGPELTCILGLAKSYVLASFHKAL